MKITIYSWSTGQGCVDTLVSADHLGDVRWQAVHDDGVPDVGRARDLSPAGQRATALRGAQRQASLLPCGADCRRRATGGAEPVPELRPLSGAVAHTASVRPWRGPLTQAQEEGRPRAAVKAQVPGLPKGFHQSHVSDPCT